MSIIESLPPQALEVADKSRKFVWGLTNKRVFGSGVMIQEGQQGPLLLVRNAYGDSNVWSFPGGGIASQDAKLERKQPAGAVGDIRRYELGARRELTEELDYPVQNLRGFGHIATSYYVDGPGRDLYAVFRSETDDLARDMRLLTPAREIAEFRAFELGELKTGIKLHHGVARAISEIRP